MKPWWWWFSLKLCPTLVTPWTVVCQAPLSMGFSRQEYWNGLLFSSPRLLCPWDFPGKNTGMGCCFLLQGIFPTQAYCIAGSLLHCSDSLLTKPPGKPREAFHDHNCPHAWCSSDLGWHGLHFHGAHFLLNVPPAHVFIPRWG